MPRQSRKTSSPIDLDSELDELLSNSSVAPNLAFLGLGGTAPDVYEAPSLSEDEEPVVETLETAAPVEALEEPGPILSRFPEPVTAKTNGERPKRNVQPRVKESPSPHQAIEVQPAAPVEDRLPYADISSEPEQQEDEPKPVQVATVEQRRKRIHKCSIAQHGHSHVEQEVYATLWRVGSSVPGEPDVRLARIGHASIAKEARIHERNVTEIIKRLVQKLAIEIESLEDRETRTARTYRVFSYVEILKRRKDAGLEWVMRRRGVEFVDPETGEPLYPVKKRITASDGVTASGAVTPSVRMAITASGPDGVKPGATDAVTPSLLDNERNYSGNTPAKHPSNPTTTSFSGFQTVLHELNQVAFADEQAVDRLIQGCKVWASDVSAEEICHFVQEKSKALGPQIKNPIGFLLVSVPKCFVGEAFVQYREAQRAEKNRRDEQEREERSRREELANAAVNLLIRPGDTPKLQQAIREAFCADPYQSIRDFLDRDDYENAQRAWNLIRDHLKVSIAEHTFEVWFRPLQGLLRSGSSLRVLVPMDSFLFVQDKFAEQLKTAMTNAKAENPELEAIDKIEFFSGENFVL